MHIIFDKTLAEKNYTLLELDTFMKADNSAITAYCVLDTSALSPEDLFHLDARTQLHDAMMTAYKTNDHKTCFEALQILKTYWKGEVTSFYEVIENRISNSGVG